tara:strand:+ start:48 stop:569 length:522 start_codon:yes stop_codon:yes gene_type:complete
MNKQEIIDEAVHILFNGGFTRSSEFLHSKFAEQKKPFDRWYVDDSDPKYIGFEGLDSRYGLNRSGDWFRSDKPREGRRIVKGLRLATDAEILEKLSAYAASIGVKTGATIESFIFGEPRSLEFNSRGFIYYSEVNRLSFNGCYVMMDGKWATVLEEPKTIEDRLEAIEKHLNL